jgi:hypothetical protein
LISIPGRAFPVTTFFLEDALEHTAFKVRRRMVMILVTEIVISVE